VTESIYIDCDAYEFDMMCITRTSSSASCIAHVEISVQLDWSNVGAYFGRDLAAQHPSRELEFRIYSR
jgi:hypothetical protein